MNNIPIGAYTFSDSYLRKLKKDELIEHYRTLEKNWFNEIKSSNIQIDNSKKLLKEEYNKAVDDCIEELKKRRDTRYMKVNCDDVELKMLSKKLKGAKQNEDFK